MEETLSGQQPIYLAACVDAGRRRYSELVVLAEFDAQGGLGRVHSPQNLSRWIAGSPWYEAREASTWAQLLEGGAFAAARFMPGSDTEHVNGEHRFEIELLKRDNVNCENTSLVRVKHHTARGESTVEIMLSQEIGC